MPTRDDVQRCLLTSLRRLGDARSVEHGVVTSAATGALALIDPAALGPRARFALRLANAGLGAVVVWASLRDEPQLQDQPGLRGGLTAGAAGLTLAAAELGEAADARFQHRLERAGVPAPRLAMALGAVAATAASWWFSKRSADQRELEELERLFDDELPMLEEQLVDVPAPVRALVEALLERSEDHGSYELRAQLKLARAVEYDGEGEEAFYPGIGFAIPEGSPLAVPGNANFPVVGRYTALDDRIFDAVVSVQEGRLANLLVQPASDWTEEEQLDWFEQGRDVQELPGWPTPDQLEFLVETREGLKPLA